MRKEEKKTGGGIEILESFLDREKEREREVEASLTLAAAAIAQSQLMAGNRNKFHYDKKKKNKTKKQLDSFQRHIQSATSGFSWRFDSHDRGNLGVPPTSIDQSAESNSYSILLHSGKLIVPAWGESKVSPGGVRFFLFCFFFQI